ncbi:hypothetical protein OE88DRAFT_1290369 [Heliocybe sulcata]|uniref:Uncharacterized protein n=1 Tax=Heliocybe sulcata TaxID=5364 RepID=A0A5C3MUZ6_9AGAM|nr:hypothetical protein OE88DRAFT_1290369 [Heliocybe sulcata]
MLPISKTANNYVLHSAHFSTTTTSRHPARPSTNLLTSLNTSLVSSLSLSASSSCLLSSSSATPTSRPHHSIPSSRDSGEGLLWTRSSRSRMRLRAASSSSSKTVIVLSLSARRRGTSTSNGC